MIELNDTQKSLVDSVFQSLQDHIDTYDKGAVITFSKRIADPETKTEQFMEQLSKVPSEEFRDILWFSYCIAKGKFAEKSSMFDEIRRLGHGGDDSKIKHAIGTYWQSLLQDRITHHEGISAATSDYLENLYIQKEQVTIPNKKIWLKIIVPSSFENQLAMVATDAAQEEFTHCVDVGNSRGNYQDRVVKIFGTPLPFKHHLPVLQINPEKDSSEEFDTAVIVYRTAGDASDNYSIASVVGGAQLLISTNRRMRQREEAESKRSQTYGKQKLLGQIQRYVVPDFETYKNTIETKGGKILQQFPDGSAAVELHTDMLKKSDKGGIRNKINMDRVAVRLTAVQKEYLTFKSGGEITIETLPNTDKKICTFRQDKDYRKQIEKVRSKTDEEMKTELDELRQAVQEKQEAALTLQKSWRGRQGQKAAQKEKSVQDQEWTTYAEALKGSKFGDAIGCLLKSDEYQSSYERRKWQLASSGHGEKAKNYLTSHAPASGGHSK